MVSIDCISSAAHAGAPDYLNPAADHHTISLDDVDALNRLCTGIDAVCHQAARVGLGKSFADVTDYVRDNGIGTANLFRALFRNRFHGRIVQASSMVVYGEGRYLCPDHGNVAPGERRVEDLASGRFDPPCPACGRPLRPTTVDESAPLSPRNVYAATKVHQEHLGAAFACATGSDVVSLRYHNVYGPRMPRDTPYAGVASIFRSACEAGESPTVYEDGGQRRDFIHVEDVAAANLLALSAPQPIGGEYNIATGDVRTVGDVAQAIWRGCDRPGPPPIVTHKFRVGDVRHITASPDLARSTFGFTASISADDGLRTFATAPLRDSLRR